MDALTAVVLLLLAPPVTAADLDRFPPFETQQEQLRFAYECVEVVKKRRVAEFHNGGLWADRERAMYVGMSPWSHLTCADPRMVYVTPEQKLDHLRELRNLLGARDYALGRMPPAVPPGLFEPLD